MSTVTLLTFYISRNKITGAVTVVLTCPLFLTLRLRLALLNFTDLIHTLFLHFIPGVSFLVYNNIRTVFHFLCLPVLFLHHRVFYCFVLRTLCKAPCNVVFNESYTDNYIMIIILIYLSKIKK